MYENVRLFVSFFSLLLIVVVVAFTYVLLKGKGNYLNRNSRLKEVTRYYFSAKTYISILQLDDKLLLLGVTDSSITLLGELDEFENSQKVSSNFGDLLNEKLDNEIMVGIKSRLRQMRENDDEKNK
jgi:flagellar biogenesis protein FliO